MPSKKEFTEADRLQRRLAAHHRWAKSDPVEGTKKAREKFLASFLAKVDEHAAEQGETLTDAERTRRAESLKKAHFVDMSRKSALARQRRKAKAGASA